jgi:hypothetical protein
MSVSVNLDSIDNAFTRGGNRLCFFHPANPDICIKIIRPDRTPSIRKQQKKFPKNLRPLSSFNENLLELQEMRRIVLLIGDAAFDVVPRCHGMVKTDLGAGLCSEMIRDDDGKVSISLKQYLWQSGITEGLQQAITRFSQQWIQLGMPSRDLLLHNIVVQLSDHADVKRLVVIDGLGWSGLSRLCYFIKPLARYRARKKIQRLKQAVRQLLDTQKNKGNWGYHGWLDESQRHYSHHD